MPTTLRPARALLTQVLAPLFIVLLVSGTWSYAQTPFMDETEFIVRDGGRWITENPSGSPQFFGAEHAWTFDQNGASNVMVFKVFGFDAEGDSVQYWQGFSGWDPISQTVEVRQFGSFSGPSQAIATGTETRLDENTTELALTIRYLGGATVNVVDRAIVTGPDTYTSQSFENGELQSELQWTRVTAPVAADPPAAPVPTTRLAPPYPNPTDRLSTFDYEVARPGPVRLDVFDVRGRLVRTLFETSQDAGPHTATWDGTDTSGQAVAAGVYLYRLTTPTDSATQRVTLVR